MVLMLIIGLFVATIFTTPAETAVEDQAPRFSGVLKRQDTVRLKTKTVDPESNGSTSGFVQAPTGQ